MVKLYADLVRAGLRTLDKVPPLWRDAVGALLEENKGE